MHMSTREAAPTGPIVILVSDDPETRRALEQWRRCADESTTIRSFDHATEALRFIESAGKHTAEMTVACLLDVATPDLPAHVFAENLHALPGAAATPLLLLLEENRLETEGTEHATDLIVKPIRARELAARLRNSSRLHRLARSRKRLERQLELARTEHRITSARLKYRTHHDELTGLFNRQYLEQRLETMTLERGRQAALLYIDIGRFKVVNTYEGYLAGDRLLNRIARVIREVSSERDIVARSGSDEFAMLLIDRSEPEVIEIGEKLRRQLSEARFPDTAHFYPLTASIGIAMMSEEHETKPSEALTHAYQACFVAKSETGNAVHVYNERDRALVRERRALHWVPMIRQALNQERFRLVFQPLLDIRSGRIEQYEVLLRMVGEDGSLMAPGEFIGVAEQTGLIHDIDRWVVSEALQVLAGTTEPIRLSVNLSGKAFNDSSLVPFFERKLQQIKGDPSRITFEITETAAIGNLEETRRMVHQLREMGCRFALDDFGAGFNSYAHLKQFPVDTVKIDGSFIANLATDRIDRQLVRSMADIARRLGKRTVAEFVENMETLRLLEELGVDAAQGFFIGRPDPGMPTLRAWAANDSEDQEEASGARRLPVDS
jgi:diguanylate cyclase (GGDEF)-like protein